MLLLERLVKKNTIVEFIFERFPVSFLKWQNRIFSYFLADLGDSLVIGKLEVDFQ